MKIYTTAQLLVIFLLSSALLYGQKKPKSSSASKPDTTVDAKAQGWPKQPVDSLSIPIISLNDIQTFSQAIENIPHSQYVTLTVQGTLQQLAIWKIDLLKQEAIKKQILKR